MAEPKASSGNLELLPLVGDKPTVHQWEAINSVEWDRLIMFIRSEYPGSSQYGGDAGGDATNILVVLNDYVLLAEIADRLRKIDTAANVKLDPLLQQIDKINSDHLAAIKALREELLPDLFMGELRKSEHTTGEENE